MARFTACASLCGLLVAAFSAVAPGAPAFAAAADSPGQTLDVTVTSGRLSVRVHEARLADVLEAVGRQAGVRVMLRGDVAAPITETFVDVALEEGIRRLSRSHSVVLVYDPSPPAGTGAVLGEIWVTASSPDGLGRAELTTRSTPRTDTAPRPLMGPTEGLARNLIAWKDANPETRREQIKRLVQEHGAAAAVAALRETATRDSAPGVRRAAIQVLAIFGSPDAIDAVRATLHDANPGVRSEAQTALRRQSRPPVSEDLSEDPGD
jgi:hypothetical protein